MKNKAISRIIIIAVLTLVFRWSDGLCQEKPIAGHDVQCSDGKLNIDAVNLPLSKLIEEIRRKCFVNISGLDHRANESVTFLARNELQEIALKRLLRQLDEESYAFEYTRSGLNRIVVVPRSTAKYTPAPFPSKAPDIAPPFPPLPPPVPAETPPVSVMDVIQGSQAEAAGLQKGDMVLEYDGVKITDSQQLIQEVKNRETKEVVEVTVMRNNTPMTFVLKGGFMGINIANTNPK